MAEDNERFQGDETAHDNQDTSECGEGDIARQNGDGNGLVMELPPSPFSNGSACLPLQPSALTTRR